jgi:hypothetical protein
MLAVMIIAAQAVQQAPAVPPTVTVIERSPRSEIVDFEISGIGSCLRQGSSVDLRRLWLLEQPTVVVDTPAGPLTVTAEGDKLRIAEAADEAGRRVYVWEIGYMFADERGNADVRLRLGVLDSVLVLYWRETYQHRMYRQGLFRIAGREIVPLCEGEGGITWSH